MNYQFDSQLVLPPGAAALTGTTTTEPIHLKHSSEIHFLVTTGEGAVGTHSILAEACADERGTGAVPVRFIYRKALDGDKLSDYLWGEQEGIQTEAGENKTYLITVSDQALGKLEKPYVRLKIKEKTVGAVSASVTAITFSSRFGE